MKNAHTAKRIRIGFAISDDPDSGDEEFEQDGLRIFVEETLVEPLEDRTLGVEEGDDGMRLVCLGPLLSQASLHAPGVQRGHPHALRTFEIAMGLVSRTRCT